MNKKITFLTKIIIINFYLYSVNLAAETVILPLKKPILDAKTKAQKLSKNIIKPKPKPQKKINQKEKVVKSFIEPSAKPKKGKKKEKINTEIVEKETIKRKIDFLIPKAKPLVVKKDVNKNKKTSKYYKKRDFDLAKKSIRAFEKGQWSTAISLSKKARDKSIYNFIQWKHLLTSGNQATFYDYLVFIKKNENYPRIGRLKYLAEHKLSTDKISPKKIINSFNLSEPLSGFGKMMLGESLIMKGEVDKGISLIKSSLSVL